jgi:hypothetical protein
MVKIGTSSPIVSGSMNGRAERGRSAFADVPSRNAGHLVAALILAGMAEAWLRLARVRCTTGLRAFFTEKCATWH